MLKHLFPVKVTAEPFAIITLDDVLDLKVNEAAELLREMYGDGPMLDIRHRVWVSDVDFVNLAIERSAAAFAFDEEGNDRRANLIRDVDQIIKALHDGRFNLGDNPQYRPRRYVNLDPCTYDDHKWALVVEHGELQVKCLDPCLFPVADMLNPGSVRVSACDMPIELDDVMAHVRVSVHFNWFSEEDWHFDIEAVPAMPRCPRCEPQLPLDS